MKKIILLACFGIFMVSGLLGQEVDFKYKVDSTNTNPKQYSVTVTITKGVAPFIVHLYDGIPWKGGTLIQSKEGTTNSVCVFKNILPGKIYLLSVQLQNNDGAVVHRSFKLK